MTNILNPNYSHFESTATNYSLFNAFMLVEASQLAYESERTIKNAVRETWGMKAEFISKTDEKHLIFNRNIDTQAFIAGNDKDIIIAFRGTEPINFTDWKTNFQLGKLAVPLANSNQKVHVHEGFWQALDLVWNDIIEGIRTFQDRGQSIWLTGHSLGGALAQLAAFRLSQSSDFSFSGLYTFGQPRVGTSGFARFSNRSYKNKFFRFVNNNDLVTFVPPFFWGYRDTGQLYYLTADRKIVKDGLPWLKAIKDRIVGIRDIFAIDHDIQTYVDIIRENVSA